jgi:flavin-dependent dehydrogenase
MPGRAAEVVVLGSGPAGLSAAIGLSGRGLRVTLIALARAEADRVGESLSPAAAPLLRGLGVWDAFVADGHAPCFGNASAWGDRTLRFYDFLRDPRGHAWHIDRRRFERRLAERAEAVGVTPVRVARPPRCDWNGDGWRVWTGHEIRPNFVLDATGRSAWLGRRCGALRIAGDSQVAAVAFLEADACRGPIEDTTSLVEAVERGWWYSAALPKARLVAAFMTDHDLLPAGPTKPDTWLSLLDGAAHTARRLAEGGYRLTSPPRVVAASGGWLEPVAGAGWAAVGDAAMCYDPLASHGLTLALASGRDAAEAVSSHLRGDFGAIEAYTGRLRAAFADYSAVRLEIYRAERRWPDAPYWRRRHELPPEHARR